MALPNRAPLRQHLVLWLIVAAALILSHPFSGIRHDGTLYAGEALARLIPGEFRDDLYFTFGSQGRFTLLPTLYAGLIDAFGLGTGTLVGLAAAFALYTTATASLVSWLAPAPLRAACMLTVVLGWTIYGGNRIFGYSEAFLTARSFAEPAVLFALGLLVRGRVWSAVVALLFAVAIHPLVGAGGLLVAWLLLVSNDRRWGFPAVAAVIALVVLGALRAGPFADVFQRYDADWLGLVREANGHAFVFDWSPLDFGVVAFNVVVLWFVRGVVEDRRVRAFLVVVTLAGIGATLVSAFLVDVLHNPFVGKLQIWRTLWILQWTAMATLPIAAVALWKRGAHSRVAACCLAIGWMAPFTIAPGILAVFAVLLETLKTRFTIGTATTRIAAAATVFIGIVIAVQYEFRVVRLGILLDQGLPQILGQALAMNLVLLVLALALIRFLPRLGHAASVAALIVLVGSLAVWDQRGAWTRTLEAYRPGTHIWPGLIEPDAKVYWYRDLIAPWVLLGHGNYYTQQQGSGAVFSREMTIELDRRRKVTALLDFQEQICRMMNNLSEKQSSCEPDVAAVRTVCTDGGIDYVVLQSGLEGAKSIASFATGVVENGYEKTFFLYRCKALGPG